MFIPPSASFVLFCTAVVFCLLCNDLPALCLRHCDSVLPSPRPVIFSYSIYICNPVPPSPQEVYGLFSGCYCEQECVLGQLKVDDDDDDCSSTVPMVAMVPAKQTKLRTVSIGEDVSPVFLTLP